MTHGRHRDPCSLGCLAGPTHMLLFLLATGLGCTADRDTGSKLDSGAPPQPRSSSVLPADAWAPATGETPFGPPPEACPSTAYGVESGFFEIETDLCAFATFVQPLPIDLAATSPVAFVSWHLDLWAQEPSTATVVLQIGDERIYEATFAVPGPEDVASISTVLADDHPAGTQAWWHVSNHGYNSYRLGDVELGQAK